MQEDGAPQVLALAFMEDVFAKFAAAQPGRGGAALGTQRQQDAQEILDFLVDHAHDELNKLRATWTAGAAAGPVHGDDDVWLEARYLRRSL